MWGRGLAATLLVSLSACGTGEDPDEPITPPSTTTSTAAASGSSSAAPTTTAPPTSAPASEPSTSEPADPEPQVAGTARGSVRVVRTVADDLAVPWGLAELPDGTVLVTSRDDHHVYRIAPGTGARSDLGEIPGVDTDGGEGGLLGVAVAEDYQRTHRIYLYWSTASDNRIGYVTLRPKGTTPRLSRPTVILDGIPRGFHHNGGRIAFGPDGMLYAGTGEAEISSLAQDKTSLGGKILRMTPAGRPAPGNPFGTVVYSYGHRNVQGLLWDAAGHLFASEFGDHDKDELNWIRPGRNYGWPASQGSTTIAGYTSPVAEFGTEEDSPSGIALVNGSVFMGALAGQRLWRIPLDGTRLVAAPQSFLEGEHGRLRSVLALSDDTILVTTSNRDGRIPANAGDDKVLLIRVS